MRVVIFGGAGFVASSVIKLLLDKNYKVLSFDNNYKKSTDTLIPFVTNKNFEFILGDVTNEEDVIKAYKWNPEYILLASAIVGYPQCLRNKSLAKLVNIEGTKNVLKYKPYGTKLIFCSTGSVYKPGQKECDENAIVDHPSLYGETKVIGEKLTLNSPSTIVNRYGTAMGISFNNIRVDLLANTLTYEGYTNRVINLFEHTFLRSFVNVRDIASAIVYQLENWDKVYSIGRLFNVSNNDLNFTKGELAQKIKEKTGCHICYIEGDYDIDKRNYFMNNCLFYNTGWQPTIGMDETLDELIKVIPLLNQFEKYK